MAQVQQAAQANREMIVAGYEAFARGDLEKVRELWSDDIEWVIPGRNQLAGTYRGTPASAWPYARRAAAVWPSASSRLPSSVWT